MIPVLYAANATTFTSNGLGGLSDCISCTVTEERNGEYTLEMEYPESGLHYSDIALSCLIKAHCGDFRGTQVFRIYSITRPLNGRVKVLAQHISYQLSLIPCSPFTSDSVTAALSGLASHAAETCPFTFWTNKSTSATYSQTTPASIRSRLGGVQGSILDVYGGEFEFDMYTVKLWNSRGQNRGVTLRYGKNITDLQQEQNISNTVTGVYPFYSSDEAYVELPEKVISAASAANYPFPRTVPLDCSSQFQKTPPTEAQLRTYANSYISRAGIGVPKVNIKLSFVNLRDTLEYEDMAALERVELCDTLTVIFEQLGVETTAKVVRTAWDVLAERYNSIEVGDLKGSLATTIAEAQEKANNAVTASALETAVNAATDLITGVAGGYIRLNRDADGNPYELLIMDQPDESTAVHVWRWNVNGWGYSSTGSAGPYTMAATIDGGIVADYITAGTLTGLEINNGSGTFHVDSAGAMTATSGEIAGWTIEQDALTKEYLDEYQWRHRIELRAAATDADDIMSVYVYYGGAWHREFGIAANGVVSSQTQNTDVSKFGNGVYYIYDQAGTTVRMNMSSNGLNFYAADGGSVTLSASSLRKILTLTKSTGEKGIIESDAVSLYGSNGIERVRLDVNGLTFRNASGTVTKTYSAT